MLSQANESTERKGLPEYLVDDGGQFASVSGTNYHLQVTRFYPTVSV